MKHFLTIFLFLPLFVFSQSQPHMMHALASQDSGSDFLTGLISCWEMDEKTGTTTYDANENNDGSTNASIYQSGLLSNCYSYDGYSGRTPIPNSTSLNLDAYNSSFTVSIWVKSEDPSYGASGVRLIEKRLNGAGQYPITIQVHPTTGELNFASYDGSNFPQIQMSGSGVWDGGWHLLTYVCDSGSDLLLIYLDGAWYADKTNTVTSSCTNTGPFVIGANGNTALSYYEGLIDQVAIWSIALTADQIEALYNDGNGLAFVDF